MKSWTSTVVGSAVALGCAAGAAVVSAAPAAAEVGSSSGGFTVSVHVEVSSGAGDPVPSGGLTISVPPKCYWAAPDNFDGSSAQAFEDFYKGSLPYLQGSETAAGYYSFPSDTAIAAAVKAEKDGRDQTWYQLECQDGVNGAEEGYTGSRWTTPASYGALGNQQVPVAYRVFPAGTAPPPPLLDVKDVVESLWDIASQRIEDPDLGRNPTIDASGGATLVNLDTWFWVRNVVAALAQDGRIHLEASVPGTPVRATLDAATEGVSVTSYAGSQTCTIAEAKLAYAAQSSDDGACVVSFEKANRSGWPVTGSISWTGTWTGTDNNGAQNGTLTPQFHTTTIDVPVIESQTLVDAADGSSAGR